MQSLVIVDLLDEMADAIPCLGHIAILKHLNLFIFESAHEALYSGIVVGVATSAHADQNPAFHQHLRIGMATVLYSSIRMVDQSRPDVSAVERHPQCDNCKPWFHSAIQSPANAAPAESIQDDGQIHELVYQPDVGNIGHPELVGAS